MSKDKAFSSYIQDNYRYDKAQARLFGAKNSRFTKKTFNKGLGVIGYVFLLLLIATLIRVMVGSQSMPTFTGFLETLSSAPTVEIPFISFDMTNFLGGEWVILDELRRALAFLLSTFNVVIFFVNGIVSVITYITFLFRWLFIG